MRPLLQEMASLRLKMGSWRPLGSLLGASWEPRGGSRGPLGGSWEPLGGLWGAPGASWAHLGNILVVSSRWQAKRKRLGAF